MSRKYGPHGKARVYFYRDGEELTDHPANGFEYTGNSAYSGEIGRFKAHDQLFIRQPFGDSPSCLVDVSDFDGKPCMAKLWFAPANSEVGRAFNTMIRSARSRLKGHRDTEF